MKALTLFLASGLVVLGLQSHAQITATNKITTSEAAKIAAGLRVGMTEQDSAAFLKGHGISQYLGTNVYSLSAGCSHGWTTSYLLADGRSLGLDFRPSSIRPDGLWGGNGLLERAGIRSNGMDIVSIGLKPAEPAGGANGRQPSGSKTNQTSAADASRRSP
ncbi:MAG: hypothetical protein ACXWDN_01465 [Limisphaerales bacterium]